MQVVWGALAHSSTPDHRCVPQPSVHHFNGKKISIDSQLNLFQLKIANGESHNWDQNHYGVKCRKSPTPLPSSGSVCYLSPHVVIGKKGKMWGLLMNFSHIKLDTGAVVWDLTWGGLLWWWSGQKGWWVAKAGHILQVYNRHLVMAIKDYAKCLFSSSC